MGNEREFGRGKEFRALYGFNWEHITCFIKHFSWTGIRLIRRGTDTLISFEYPENGENELFLENLSKFGWKLVLNDGFWAAG